MGKATLCTFSKLERKIVARYNHRVDYLVPAKKLVMGVRHTHGGCVVCTKGIRSITFDAWLNNQAKHGVARKSKGVLQAPTAATSSHETMSL